MLSDVDTTGGMLGMGFSGFSSVEIIGLPSTGTPEPG